MKIIKNYMWVFEWIVSAILIALAITSLVNQELVYYFLGSIFIIFGFCRCIPLIKTTESKLMKWFCLAEMIVDVVVGILLFVFSNKKSFDNNIFGYLIGAVLYLRGFIHFFGTSIKLEPSSLIAFFTNVVFLTLGTIIIFNGGFSLSTFKWIFTVVLIICIVLLIWRGCVDYRNYRGNLVGTSKIKEMKNEIITEIETNPTSEQIQINVVPENEEIEVNKEDYSKEDYSKEDLSKEDNSSVEV